MAKVAAARLYTVRVSAITLTRAGTTDVLTVYEADFAGKHFSRARLCDLHHWVRVAAHNTYGKNTYVIFMHTEEGID